MVRFISEQKIVDSTIKCRVIDRNIHADMYINISSERVWVIIGKAIPDCKKMKVRYLYIIKWVIVIVNLILVKQLLP